MFQRFYVLKTSAEPRFHQRADFNLILVRFDTVLRGNISRSQRKHTLTSALSRLRKRSSPSSHACTPGVGTFQVTHTHTHPQLHPQSSVFLLTLLSLLLCRPALTHTRLTGTTSTYLEALRHGDSPPNIQPWEQRRHSTGKTAGW